MSSQIIDTFNAFSQRCPYFYTYHARDGSPIVNNGYNCKHKECGEKEGKIGRCHVFTCPLVEEATEGDFHDPEIDANGFEWSEYTQFCVVERSEEG